MGRAVHGSLDALFVVFSLFAAERERGDFYRSIICVGSARTFVATTCRVAEPRRGCENVQPSCDFDFSLDVMHARILNYTLAKRCEISLPARERDASVFRRARAQETNGRFAPMSCLFPTVVSYSVRFLCFSRFPSVSALRDDSGAISRALIRSRGSSIGRKLFICRATHTYK